MTTKSLYVPLPAAPCKHCVEYTLQHDDDAGIVWCSHNMVGAVYQVVPAIWNSIGPFPDEATFRRFMLAAFGPRKPMLVIN